MDTLINEIRTLQALRDEADNMRQPEANLEAEIDRETQKLHTSPCYDELRNFARHFYASGMLAERERLMRGALCGHVEMGGVCAWVKLPSKVLTDYLRSNFKDEDEVRVIIIKKEK